MTCDNYMCELQASKLVRQGTQVSTLTFCSLFSFPFILLSSALLCRLALYNSYTHVCKRLKSRPFEHAYMLAFMGPSMRAASCVGHVFSSR